MHNKSSLELSDIQLKVIEELDILTDVFASTFNQLGKIIKKFSDEITVLTDQFLSTKSDWRLYNTQCFDLSFRPFLSEYSVEKKFSLDFLKQSIEITGQKVLVKEVKNDVKKKQEDVLCISWGFKFDIEDPTPKFFYVEIDKEKSTNGSIFSKIEYEKLTNQIKSSVGILENDFYVLEHPDDGESEYFEVWLDFKYFNKYPNFFQICKDELIKKYIERIK